MRVESSGLNPIDIAISGMQVQGRRLQNISSGVASIGRIGEVTGSSGSGEGVGSGTGSGRGVVSIDDLPNQMINMNSATRAYEANVAVLKRYERMVEATLELLR